eukprot:Seg20091.1 transcript_id=Seg20091.1/GoldUCD/mRNA.D3Y31 product="hypothetical protein" protein_id=Seg20091.1/GoldUCD/D3Y31
MDTITITPINQEENLFYNGNEIVRANKPNIGVAGIPDSEPDSFAHEICRRWNTHEETIKSFKDLYLAYILLLEKGKERIEALGGDCDSVETMEKNTPSLRVARAAIAEAEGKEASNG